MPKTLYLIDGHAQIYRAYYAPFGQLTSPTGEPTRATHVFWQMVLNLVKTRKPDYLALVLDTSDETVFRKDIYPEYKAHRDAPPEDMEVQFNRIVSIAEAIQLPILRLPGFEADDILATLAVRHGRDDAHVYLVSRDKDLDQVLSPQVTIYDASKDEDITADRLFELKGWTPQQAIDAQTLIGDSTDNVPGVPGIGVKTAAKLLQKYGTAAAVVQHADELTPKQRESVLAFAPLMDRTRQLVTLRLDVPIHLDLAAARVESLQWPAARAIFRELGFRKLPELLPGGAGEADTAPPPQAAQPAQKTAESAKPTRAAKPADSDAGLFDNTPDPDSEDSAETAARMAMAANPTSLVDRALADPLRLPVRGPYQRIDTLEKLHALAAKLAPLREFAIDTETTGIHTIDSDLVGISLAWDVSQAAYIPVMSVYGTPLPLDAVRAALGPICANPAVTKVGHNLKYDLNILRNSGIDLAGPLFDTMIAAFVVDPLRTTFGMDKLVRDLFDHDMIPITDLIGKGRDQLRMDQVPLDQVVEYASEDADYTWRMYRYFAPRLGPAGVEALFRETEMPLVRVLAQMEQEGISLDADFLRQLGTKLQKRIEELSDSVQAAVGARFNIDSPKQLAEVLFDKLQMRVVRRTRTSRSTDAETLETLAAETSHPALEQILEYREMQKLKSTYIDALPNARSKRTGRVHTHYHQTGAITGRLSSSDPNLQNIPIRTPLGAEIRRAFVPRDADHLLISADYSQIELRILADFSGDEALRQAFAEDRDIHAFVAAQVNSVPIDQVTKEQRARAKAVNFGIIYGQTAFGLARGTGMGRSEAQEFIDAYFRRYARIRAFMDKCIADARRDGYVKTILGRRRPILDIDSRNRVAKAQAERLAVNTVIQGSAADLIKRAMIALDRRIREENLPMRMLLQVHDELVFESPRTEVDRMRPIILSEMSNAMKLGVPLKVDSGVGTNWLDAK